MTASGGSRAAAPRGASSGRMLRKRTRGIGVFLWVSAGIGLGITGCLAAQAFFLADLLARLFRPPARAGDTGLDLAGFAAATLLRALLLAAGAMAGAKAASAARSGLRSDALRAAIERGPAWLAGERTGALTVTLGKGLDALDAYVAGYLPRLVLAALAPAVLIAVIGALDWLSLLILLAVLGVIPVFMVLIGRLTQARVDRRSRALGALGAHFLDAVEGLPTLRAYGRARRQEAQIETVTGELRRTTLGVLREAFLSALVLETLAAVGTALVAVPLALRLIDGRMALAPALTILILTPEVFLPLRRASADFHAAAEGLEAAGRVFELLDSAPAASTPAGSAAAPPPGEAGTRVPWPPGERTPRGPRGGTLTARGLRVSYPGRDRPALERCDLQVAPGERVALAGPSGAGKSTLLAALLGLVPASRGQLAFDGIGIADMSPGDWRARFAYLPQRPRLFSGTLAANLCLGLHADHWRDLGGALDEALEVAQLTKFTAALPRGLDTEIGEGGGRLSAGERQRIALARALLRQDASVVVLDEPSAHLDATTEARLAAALDRWLAGRSLIVVSHRPRLAGLAGRTVTISGGRTGTPPEKRGIAR